MPVFPPKPPARTSSSPLGASSAIPAATPFPPTPAPDPKTWPIPAPAGPVIGGNPYGAYVWFSVGNVGTIIPSGTGGGSAGTNKLIPVTGGIPPKHLISFKYVDVMSTSGGHFELVLFDETASEVEANVLTTKDGRGVVTWGYTQGGTSPIQRTKVIQIQEYRPQLSNYGVTLTLTGVGMAPGASGAIPSFVKRQHQVWVDIDGITPLGIDQIVATMALTYGWHSTINVDIEPTADCLEYSGITPAKRKRIFTQVKMNDFQFIMNELVRWSVSAGTGLGGYQLLVDDEISGQTHLKYGTETFLSNKIVRRFDYNSGPGGGNVLEWNPDVPGTLPYVVNGSLVRSSAIVDTLEARFDMYEARYVDRTFRDPLVLYDPAKLLEEYGRIDFAHAKVNEHVWDADQLKRRMSAAFDRLASFPVQGDLVIWGDPSIRVGTHVYLNVEIKGQVHYTTGVYWIQQATHEISSGEYRTTLRLIRWMGAKNG